jgi:manganese/zinc/iron transport system substrate-binding protein
MFRYNKKITMNGLLSRLVLLLAAILVAGVLAFGGSALAQAPLKAVATTGMVADVVANVGGECVQVTTLMGPGVDPHLYRASASDVRTFQEADVIFYNGFNLEGRLASLLGRIGERVPTFALAELAAVPEAALLEGEDEFEGQTDPHLWMDASLWALTAEVVADAVVTLRPECEGAVRANAEAYQAQLLALHEWIAASIATIPSEHRVLVTAHDAFGYFGAAYGIEVEGIEGISTEAEASIADIRAVTELVVSRGVPAIFVETTINPRNVEAVRAAARERGAEVEIGGELYGDAMGEEGSPEGTYIGMLRHNVLTIVAALGGEAAPWPEVLAPWAEAWGLQGKR